MVEYEQSAEDEKIVLVTRAGNWAVCLALALVFSFADKKIFKAVISKS